MFRFVYIFVTVLTSNLFANQSANIVNGDISQISLLIFLIIAFLIYRQYQLKKHKNELESKNIIFEKMFASTMVAIIISEDNKIIEINPYALILLGVENKDELIGENIFNFISDESKELALQKEKLDFYEPCEMLLLKHDGTKLPALIQANQVNTKNKHVRIITALNLSEIKQKEQILSQSTKMAQMGAMIGNIAHQWRQPLSIITTAATGIQVKKEYGILSDEELYKFVESIEINTQYLSDTIDTFRNFIKEKVELKEVIIQKRIDNALNIIFTRIENKHIKLINKINYGQPIYATIVVGELSQVIINIINNAIDILEKQQIDKKWIQIDLTSDDKTVTITIEDNAGGIPNEILPNIFEPYFTTKHQSQGTGIGLYLSYDIIVNHMKGKLYAKNTQNGAKFFIEIPIEKRDKDRRGNKADFTPPDKRIKQRRN